MELVHLVADMTGVDTAVLDDPAALLEALTSSLVKAGFAPVAECSHKFEPCGASVAVIISESHATIHTWPEAGFAAVDLFSCAGSERALAALGYLREALEPQGVEMQLVRRGPVPAQGADQR